MLAFLIVALSATFVAASFIIIQTGRTGAAPVPSNRAMRSAMSKLLGEELDRAEADRTSAGAIRIVDLGSGWGGLTRMLAKAHPTAAFTGVELSIVPLICSRLALLASGPANANFERRNLHRALDDNASIFLAYLSPRHMESLARELRSSPPPAETVVISAAFALPGYTPDAVIQLHDLYRTPVYRYRLSSDSMTADGA